MVFQPSSGTVHQSKSLFRTEIIPGHSKETFLDYTGRAQQAEAATDSSHTQLESQVPKHS